MLIYLSVLNNDMRHKYGRVYDTKRGDDVCHEKQNL